MTTCDGTLNILSCVNKWHRIFNVPSREWHLKHFYRSAVYLLLWTHNFAKTSKQILIQTSFTSIIIMCSVSIIIKTAFSWYKMPFSGNSFPYFQLRNCLLTLFTWWNQLRASFTPVISDDLWSQDIDLFHASKFLSGKDALTLVCGSDICLPL